MRELLGRIEMMSRIMKKLKDMLKRINDEHRSIPYMPYEKPKVYPYWFMDKAAKKAHERKTDLYLSLCMFE